MPTVTGNSPRESIRFGFFAALGALILLAIGWVAMHFFVAILEIVTPFVLGLALALLLDPLVHRLQNTGVTRTQAVILVFLVFVLLLILVGTLIIPAIASEASDLASNGPAYLDNVRVYVNTFLEHHRRLAGVKMPANFDALLSDISARMSAYLQASSGQLLGYVLGSVAFLVDFLVMLIVGFYFLSDLDRLRARLMYLMPEKTRQPGRRMARDVGQVFSDYLRGLLVVCILFGVSTSLVLWVLSLFHHGVAKYALLIGAIAGLLYAIPYLGALTTAVLAFLVAYIGGGIWFGVTALVAIIVVEQVYDNLVTPKIVGGGVGLHPVMALFALVLGGHLFGIWGMVLGVPVLASVQAILFRVFPKLITPTPDEFLRREGVEPDSQEAAKYMAGDESLTEQRQEEEKDERKEEGKA